MKLRINQPCPIPSHRGSKTCCGRSIVRTAVAAPKWRLIAPGTKLFPDGHVERSPAALNKVKAMMLRRGDRCIACGDEFSDCSQIELAHKESKGMGGWKRNDDIPNLALMHADENREQGSRSLDVYLADPNRIGLKRERAS